MGKYIREARLAMTRYRAVLDAFNLWVGKGDLLFSTTYSNNDTYDHQIVSTYNKVNNFASNYGLNSDWFSENSERKLLRDTLFREVKKYERKLLIDRENEKNKYYKSGHLYDIQYDALERLNEFTKIYYNAAKYDEIDPEKEGTNKLNNYDRFIQSIFFDRKNPSNKRFSLIYAARESFANAINRSEFDNELNQLLEKSYNTKNLVWKHKLRQRYDQIHTEIAELIAYSEDEILFFTFCERHYRTIVENVNDENLVFTDPDFAREKLFRRTGKGIIWLLNFYMRIPLTKGNSPNATESSAVELFAFIDTLRIFNRKLWPNQEGYEFDLIGDLIPDLYRAYKENPVRMIKDDPLQFWEVNKIIVDEYKIKLNELNNRVKQVNEAAHIKLKGTVTIVGGIFEYLNLYISIKLALEKKEFDLKQNVGVINSVIKAAKSTYDIVARFNESHSIKAMGKLAAKAGVLTTTVDSILSVYDSYSMYKNGESNELLIGYGIKSVAGLLGLAAAFTNPVGILSLISVALYFLGEWIIVTFWENDLEKVLRRNYFSKEWSEIPFQDNKFSKSAQISFGWKTIDNKPNFGRMITSFITTLSEKSITKFTFSRPSSNSFRIEIESASKLPQETLLIIKKRVSLLPTFEPIIIRKLSDFSGSVFERPSVDADFNYWSYSFMTIDSVIAKDILEGALIEIDLYFNANSEFMSDSLGEYGNFLDSFIPPTARKRFEF